MYKHYRVKMSKKGNLIGYQFHDSTNDFLLIFWTIIRFLEYFVQTKTNVLIRYNLRLLTKLILFCCNPSIVK